MERGYSTSSPLSLAKKAAVYISFTNVGIREVTSTSFLGHLYGDA
jgi:hypothetical protein